MMSFKTITLIGALMASVLFAAIACSSEPAEPELTEAQMRNIVADAVSKSMPAPQQQVSAEDIKSMVDTAMMGMSSSQVSASEIQTMVQAAVESAAAGGASASEIETMVRSAVDAATADAVTGSDVQSAITKAVMDSQAGMITSGDVEKAVSSAVMESQAGMITGSDVEKAVSSAVMESQAGMITGSDVEKAVSSAVMESQAGMITSGDVEKAVSSAVMMAAEGALTAEDVKKILSEGAQDALTEEQVAVIVAKALEDREMMMEMESRETIIFSDLNWDSAQVQNRIAQYIADKGYGYPTDVVFGSTLPLFNGLRKGDSHVTMEIWLPNQDEAWMEAQAAGEVVSVGESLGKDWQSAFVIPAYLQQEYPDLDSVDDLKDQKFKDLFKTAGTGDKARLVSCVIGWACEAVNAKQVMGYGLDDHVQIVNPGDGAAANADLYGAYEKMEPWLGYQWGTNSPPLLLDLVRLDEPAYSDQCWFTTKACAYEDATILIAVHPEILSRAPDIVSMLRNWGFDIDRYKTVAAWQSENSEATANDAALWWLNGNVDTWSEWVTPDAASAIRAALSASEIPDGWPTQ